MREGYVDPVCPDLPVEVGRRVLEVRQERYGTLQRLELRLLNLAKPRISERAYERVFSKPFPYRQRLERADAPPKSVRPAGARRARVPGYEEWVAMIRKRRFDRLRRRKSAVKSVKGVEAVLRGAHISVLILLNIIIDIGGSIGIFPLVPVLDLRCSGSRDSVFRRICEAAFLGHEKGHDPAKQEDERQYVLSCLTLRRSRVEGSGKQEERKVAPIFT